MVVKTGARTSGEYDAFVVHPDAHVPVAVTPAGSVVALGVMVLPHT